MKGNACVMGVDKIITTTAKEVASNSMSWRNPKTRQLASMFVAEVVGGVVSLGALYYLGCGEVKHGKPKHAHGDPTAEDQIALNCVNKVEEPGVLNAVRRTIAKTCIQPLFPASRWVDHQLSGLWPDGHQRRLRMDDIACAQEYANNVVNFGGAFGIGFAAKIGTRDLINKALHAPMSNKHGWKVILIDEGVYLGSILAMNCLFPKQTNHFTNIVSKTLQGVGISKEKADSLALYTVVSAGPNILAFGVAGRSIWKGDPHMPHV